MSSDLIVVKPGQSVGDAAREDLQQRAAAKQLVDIKKGLTPKFVNVLNALFQNLGIGDPDFAASVCVSYAAGIAIALGSSEEAFTEGAKKAWDNEKKEAEDVKEQQRKMNIITLKRLAAEKKPVPAPFLAHLKALGCTIPPDLQEYIDSQQPAGEAQEASAPEAAAKN